MERLVGAQARLLPGHVLLPFLLLLAAVLVWTAAVIEVHWVPDDTALLPAALLGFLLAALLARRSLSAPAAWSLITAYGLLVVISTLAQLWPPPRLWSDWPALRLFWLENGADFAARVGAWFTAVYAGGRSNETIVFALLVGLLAWFSAAFVGWVAYRHQQPLTGLLLLGLLLAVNSYYGSLPLPWGAFFIGLATLTTAVFHWQDLEASWEQRGMDYATGIRIDLLASAAGISLALLALAYVLPTITVRSATNLLLDNEQVAALEESLERAFGGVEVARTHTVAPGRAGGTGVLPRGFLLGSGPELERFIMMTATAEILDAPTNSGLNVVRHWRGLSYPVYTGRGWTLSPEQRQRVPAGESLPHTTGEPLLIMRQQVHWRYDNRAVRFSLGLPLRIDQPVTAVVRPTDDLARILGPDGAFRYELISYLPAATPEQLRSTTLDTVPSRLMARYTQLPDTVPDRVHNLAAEVTAGQATPYDQARALERFLRQYPYSLDVPAAPPDVDLVDFFLFEAQAGYCDYYASAMVVMARSLGLPARLATGYLAQPPDESGTQTIRQSDAHSWAEIYFPGRGWIEFEPTGGLPTTYQGDPLSGAFGSPPILPQAAAAQPLPPPQNAARPLPWRWLVISLLGLLLLGWLFWRISRRRRWPDDAVQGAYGRLQRGASRLGLSISPSQTPDEFVTAFQLRLQLLRRAGPRRASLAEQLDLPAAKLTTLFKMRQYRGPTEEQDAQAKRIWRGMRRPLWLLGLTLIRRPQLAIEEQDNDNLA